MLHPNPIFQWMVSLARRSFQIPVWHVSPYSADVGEDSGEGVWISRLPVAFMVKRLLLGRRDVSDTFRSSVAIYKETTKRGDTWYDQRCCPVFFLVLFGKKKRMLKNVWEIISLLTYESFDNSPQICPEGISHACWSCESDCTDRSESNSNHYKWENTSKGQFFWKSHLNPPQHGDGYQHN